MKEAAESKVDLRETTPHIVNLMLKHAYGDHQWDADEADIKHLYVLADRLQMTALADDCRRRLASSARLGSLVQLALQFNDDRLEEICAKRASDSCNKKAYLKELLSVTCNVPGSAEMAERLILAAGFGSVQPKAKKRRRSIASTD